MRWRDEPVSMRIRPVDVLLARHPFLRERLRDGAPAVMIDAHAHAAATGHVAAHRVEQGGLLVGQPYARSATDAAITLVHIRTAVPGDDATGDAISLRMEAAVWSHAREALRPGELVVGWFHSHPGIGAFFSETDRRTQAAFFAQAYSIGWVIDPVRNEEAWFVSAAAEAVPASRVVVVQS